MSKTKEEPLVKTQTTSSSESIMTVLQYLKRGKIHIPDYQRDADQWDEKTKSLFIESVLNNLTIPAFFLCDSEKGKQEVVDGQQRLMVLQLFRAGGFTLVSSNKAPYLDNSVHYAGKTFDGLLDSFKEAFEDYKLTMIQLPSNLEHPLRLEIFRRINQAGTPLTPQDIRLSYYGNCVTVNFIRLTGIYDPARQGSKRMLESAKNKYKLEWPWEKLEAKNHSEWKEWWDTKQLANGQRASEMFLWFVIARYRHETEKMLTDKNHLSSQLNTSFSGRIEEVADIFCAQLQKESGNNNKTLCDLKELKKMFIVFADWFYTLRLNLTSAVAVQKFRRIAFIISALFEYSSKKIKDNPKGLLEQFIRSPGQTSQNLKIKVPAAKG